MALISVLNPKRFRKSIDTFELKPFNKTFTKSFIGLSVNGVYPGPRSYIANCIIVVNFIMQITAIWMLIYTFVIDVKNNDFYDATRQMSLASLLITMVIKMINLFNHRKKIESLIRRIDDDYVHAVEHLDQIDLDIVKKYAISGVWIQDMWTYLVVTVGQVFGLSAVVFMLYSYVYGGKLKKRMVFYLILPNIDEYKYTSPLFEIFFVYEIMEDLLSMCLYIGFDPLVPIFTQHLCGQLEMIKRQLIELYDNNHTSDEQLDIVLQRKLNKIVESLQKTYTFAQDVNKMCSTVYELVFSFCPLLITASAFQIFSCLRKNEIPYEFGFFFVATVFHVFIPSYYGNLMIEKSLSVCMAAYDSSWEMTPHRASSSTLLIIMLRAQRPLELITMFKPVSLLLFSEACQQSWTLFNLMLAMFK